MSSGATEGSVSRSAIPTNQVGFARIAQVCTVVAALWLWLAIASIVVGGVSAWLVAPVGFVCGIAFGGVAAWAIQRRANPEPGLIIDEAGVFDNVSIAQAGRVKWPDMARVWIAGPVWMQFICILPEHLPRYLADHEGLRGMIMHINCALVGAPIIVPTAVLNMPPEDIWMRIAKASAGARATSQAERLFSDQPELLGRRRRIRDAHMKPPIV